MASQTSALPDGSTLTKPAYTDSADIAVINTNMDKIVSNINAENQALATLNSNIVVNTTLKNVTIPDGTLQSSSTIELDFTSIVPSGYEVYGATIAVQANGGWYVLPWYNNGLTQILMINRLSGKKIYLRNASTGWGTSNLSVSLFLKRNS